MAECLRLSACVCARVNLSHGGPLRGALAAGCAKSTAKSTRTACHTYVSLSTCLSLLWRYSTFISAGVMVRVGCASLRFGRSASHISSMTGCAVQVLQADIDLLHPPAELEARSHKLKRLVQSPNSFFMDVKCPGCFQMCAYCSPSCFSCGCMHCVPRCQAWHSALAWQSLRRTAVTSGRAQLSGLRCWRLTQLTTVLPVM